MTVRYDSAGSRCAEGPQPGLIELRRYVLSRWGGQDLGIFNCRPVRDGQTLSFHGEGRAWDWRAGSRDLLDQALAFVEAHVVELQVQEIIDYQRQRRWDSRRGWGPFSPSTSPGGPAWHVTRNWDGARDARPIVEILNGDAQPEPEPIEGDVQMLPWWSRPITSGPFSGRWPFVALNPERTAVLGFNGCDFTSATPAFGVNVVRLPAGAHGHRLEVAETPDGSGVLVTDPADGGTFRYAYRPATLRPPIETPQVDVDALVAEVIREITARLAS